MFSVAAATGLAKPLDLECLPRRSCSKAGGGPPQVRTQDGFVRRRNGFAVVNLTPLFFPTANATADRNHKNDRDIAYRT